MKKLVQFIAGAVCPSCKAQDTIAINAEDDHWGSATTIDEKTYTNEVSKWLDEGATIIAGCCRTRPSHIEHMVKNLIN